MYKFVSSTAENILKESEWAFWNKEMGSIYFNGFKWIYNLSAAAINNVSSAMNGGIEPLQI